jgi:superfamily I DNA and/or RNA helicase
MTASVSRPITLDDILIVAPYNAQVAALKEAVPGARVGTVDKFQGQEAPIVIYSMTTSSSADAPRGMSFLYSPNRLNVATSRARALVIVVASPLLFTPEARSPEQMRLANAFCRFAELSGTMAAELIEVSVQ